MNLTDLKKLSMAKKQLADTLLSESEAAENNKKLEWDLEIETTKVLVTMDEKVKMQNSAMRKLLSTLPSELAPSESEIPPTLNTGNVGFEGNCTKQQSIISPYLLEQSKRALSHVKKLESSNYAAKTLAQEHDMIMDLKKNKEELQSAHKELLQNTQNQTKEYTKQLESKKLELESEKLKCGQLMAQSSEPVAAEHQRLIDNQNELKEKREVLAKLCEDGEVEFGLKLEEHTAFKLECRKMVDDFYDYVQQQNKEYVAQVQADAKEIQELHDSRFRPIEDNR
uniref:Uncharacterized protein n=1 Tax=Ciona savignyi TaxID=51511 RepID=H2Z2Q6_CIOSA